MASKLKSFLIKSFAGGLNVYSNATQVDDSESPDLMNVDFSGIGSIRKRMGYQKLTETEPDSGDRIQGIFSYKTSSVNEILYVANGVLYKYDGAGGSDTISGGTFSTSANVNAAQVGDRLYFYDGVTALSYYNGTTISTTGVASAPTYPDQGIFYNKRQYINSNANKDRVYYSKPLSSTGASTDTGSFDSGATTAGFFGFGTGYEVVGFARLSNYLYVFCKNAIFRIEPVVSAGTITDHTSIQISGSVGCRAPRSIDNVGNDVYFLDSTIYSLGEIANFLSLRTTNVSAKVSRIFENMTQSQISRAAAINYTEKEVYMIAIETAGLGYNDTILGFSLPYKSWFRWDSMKVNCWLEYVDSSNMKHLYFGSDDDSDAYVFEAYSGTDDDGAAIDAYYYTKEFDIKEFDVEKLFQMWSIQFGGVYGEVTVDFLVEGVVVDSITLTSGVSTSDADGWGSLAMGTFPMGLDYNSDDVAVVDSGLNNDWRRHDLNGQEGTTFQFKFSNASVGQGFEIKQAIVRYLDFNPYKIDTTREV